MLPGSEFAAASSLTEPLSVCAPVAALATSDGLATLCQASDDLSLSSSAWIVEASCEAIVRNWKKVIADG